MIKINRLFCYTASLSTLIATVLLTGYFVYWHFEWKIRSSDLVPRILAGEPAANLGNIHFKTSKVERKHWQGKSQHVDQLVKFLASKPINRDFCRDLLHCRSLEHLQLTDQQLDQSMCSTFRHLKRLSSLELQRCKLSGHLPSFNKHEELQSVSFASSDFSKRSFSSVICAPQLKKLSLAYCNISDSDVAQIAEHAGLIEELDLSYTSVTDDCFLDLRRMNALKLIGLSGMQFHNWTGILEIQSLQEVWLVGTNINDEELRTILHLPHLRVLNVHGCANVPDRFWDDVTIPSDIKVIR